MTEYDIERRCVTCRYMGVDPDGAHCGHPTSFSPEEGGIFGRSIEYARREGNFCGPQGKLWEKDPKDRFEQIKKAREERGL